MSAITGIYHTNREPINCQHGQTLMSALQKYPADDVQIWYSDKVFLGCHAQWITPESVGERLPFYDHERGCAITTDAIIDNRKELFEKLQVKSTDQKSITDSELILLSYYKWGEESPKHLIGDFAFMIWDEVKQQLFGARDPSGYRTLYYNRDSSRFVFCTTIEPLLSLPNVKKELNERWLAQYLAIAGMTDTVDGQMTPYHHIEQLPPFHTIVITETEIKCSKYGTFLPKEQLRLKSNNEYVEAFQEVFQKAVNSRLRTHRSIGSYLSGGLDSGAVVGFAVKAMKEENKTLHTFSYIPPSDFVDFTPKHLLPDETPFIKETVEYVGGISDHYCAFEGRNTYLELDNLLDIMEIPFKFLQNSFWLNGVFEKAHEEKVGILLNGEKGNFTISWGSAMDYYALLLKQFNLLRFYREFMQYNRNVGGSRLGQLKYITGVAFPFLNQTQSNGTSQQPTRFINPAFAERTDIFNKLKPYGVDESGWFAPTDFITQRRILFEDAFHWNAGHTLDCKLSLRYGLWKRDPTNDIQVIRFCLSLPEEQYIQNGYDRALVRRATKNILPNSVRLNQHVRGVQGADWVHRMTPNWSSFIEEVKQLSTDERIVEFIDPRVLSSALKTGGKGPRQNYYMHDDYTILLRTLVIGRFLNRFL
ncbi:asparagine synthase-related protein [Niallia sp. XMNu-256]|uniref:asparagine synthase-related protein n=1 Tax=Niallia sp. XMNu-256 TaxID=3082444 RepID=UPI0030CC1780